MREFEPSLRSKLSQADIRGIRARGMNLQELHKEMQTLVRGAPHIRLIRACRPRDGIRRISPSRRAQLIGRYAERDSGLRVSKFVAASGAATRMFHIPSACLSKGLVTGEAIESAARQGADDAREMRRLLRNLERFAFIEDLRLEMRRRGLILDDLLAKGRYNEVLEALLAPDGLNYARLPKALIPFHLYAEGPRTPLEEHLIEGCDYLRDREGRVRVHFTVPSDFLMSARGHVSAAKKRFRQPGVRFVISFSVQERATDTIACDMAGWPARDSNGGLLFMQSGHGALLDNLGKTRSDLVFLRTIDNVLPERLNHITVDCRRMLGGYFLELQDQANSLMEALSECRTGDRLLRRAEEFIESEFSSRFPDAYRQAPARSRAGVLMDRLNRPLRVCGMVRLKGGRGGRPFWVADPDGTESLQIVEGAQVDMHTPGQRAIWASTDYFNPADMVCGLQDYRGNYFDLREFRDPQAGFITLKSVAGQQVKVLERPGLWNGGMARWNTVFVEIPAATVHPVKSILDLLDPWHRVQSTL